MKSIRKTLLTGAIISFLAVSIPGSYLIFSGVVASNVPMSKVVTIEYRITSSESLSAIVDFKAGGEVLSSQQVKLPWKSEIKKNLKVGDPVALYFSTYNNKPTSLTYEIWVNGEKVAAQTDESQDFISNNISFNYR